MRFGRNVGKVQFHLREQVQTHRMHLAHRHCKVVARKTISCVEPLPKKEGDVAQTLVVNNRVTPAYPLRITFAAACAR